MKKIYIFAAVLALLTLSLNAQYQAEKKKAIQTATTEKKVGTPNYGIQKTVTLITGNRAPSRAPMRGDRATQTWSWTYGNALPSDWSFGDPTNTGWGDNQDGTYYIGVTSSDVQPSEFSIRIPASVFSGYTDNVQVEIRAKADAGYYNQTISVNGDSKSITTSLNTYTWTNVDVTNGIVINPTDSYTGLASIIITGESSSSGDSNDETICNGTNTNGYLPIYGLYCDDYQINQMIYPENLLTNLVGKTLTSMTFYATAALNANLSSVGWDVKLGTTSQASFASSLSSITRLVPDNVTTVAQGYVITSGINTMTITFSTPFTYNGGNLLVDFQSTAEGQYKSTEFYGVNQSTVTGYNSYRSSNATPNQNGHYSSGNVRQFLPKVTFTYEKEDQHDLAIALSAPATAGAGSTVDVTATVTNNGDFAENGYTVTVSDGTNIVNITAQEALGIGETTTFTVQFATSPNAGGSTVNYTATVACTDDAVAGNNTATASTSLLNCPPPENVAATADGNSGTMTWDAPTIPMVLATYTWDFEEEADFTSFTTIDNDGDGYNWAWHQNTGTSNLEVHSGNGLIYSQSYDKPTSTVLYPNNWLISPEINLGGTLTFWACGQDPNQYWNEVFGVYVCVGSYNGVSNFVQVDADSTTTHNMKQYTYDLSQYQGQGYFAIVHHNVSDEFYLDVDDIEYQVPVPGEQPTSYNIYLDGQLVGNVLSTDALTYTFNNLSDGTYQCAVSAVYSYGESAQVPATFTIAAATPTIEIAPATQTISDAAAGTLTITGTDIEGNINVSAGNDWSLNPTSLGNTGGDVNVTYTGRDLSATTTVTATDANDNTVTASATVDYVADLYIVGNFGSGWDFTNGTSMSYNNGTYTATLTVDAGNYILFARLLGNSNPWNTRDVFGPSSNGDWWMDADQKNGTIDVNDDDPIYFTESGTYTITINSDGTFTITKQNEGQTAPPVITYTVDDEYVTITATGNGTVTLNVPGYDPVIGENGVATITVPRGYVSNTITVSATAQESGKDESDPTYRDITIPAGSDWVEMDGTYDNPNDLLSFLKNNEDIMMVDQFAASTVNNDHPDHYTYTLRQTVNGETQTSTPVSIPVYKTNSTMQGLYTQTQVDNDTLMQYRANVLNTEMDFDVNPDRNVLYYSLYRGDLNATYPEITAQSRVSQLQKFEEMVGEGENAQPQYFLFESHPEGIAPRYDRLGTAIAERLDTNWVEAGYDDQLAYVPVIWTYGLYTARGDGKNNSYGSDIKNSYLGKVDISVTGFKNDENNTTGQWDSNGMTYCVYSPIITLNGHTPEFENPNDGDTYQYVPYMYRVWCTYPSAHNFTFVANNDGSGRKHLVDAGPIEAPFLIGEATAEDSVWHNNGEEVIIGRALASGEVQQPWSFGVPKTEDSKNVKFIARFYYKKIVTPAAQANGLRGNRGSERAFAIAQNSDDGSGIVTGISELSEITYVVSKTYVNAQGMQSDKPFDGLNIVVTRFSDGTTTTTKVVR